MNYKYVVVGKGLPRSVGFSDKRSAIKYAEYHKQKSKKAKPRIIIQTEKYLSLRFKKRFHNTDSWRLKLKKLKS